MSQGFYNGVASLAVQGRRLELTAQNVANATATGFKRHVSVIHNEINERGQEQQIAREAIDFGQGGLLRTERPLDLALNGEGFFAIETSEGEGYTRNGAFELDRDGVLITQSGMPVAWDGSQGRLDPLGAPIEISSSGDVRQGDVDVGRLRLVNFGDPQQLRQISGGVFVAPRGLGQSVATAELHQGALESSNTTALDEMVEMIAIQRHFGAVTQVLSAVKSSYDRITNPR